MYYFQASSGPVGVHFSLCGGSAGRGGWSVGSEPPPRPGGRGVVQSVTDVEELLWTAAAALQYPAADWALSDPTARSELQSVWEPSDTLSSQRWSDIETEIETPQLWGFRGKTPEPFKKWARSDLCRRRALKP